MRWACGKDTDTDAVGMREGAYLVERDEEEGIRDDVLREWGVAHDGDRRDQERRVEGGVGEDVAKGLLDYVLDVLAAPEEEVEEGEEAED